MQRVKDKKKPITTFCLNFQIPFAVSSTVSLEKRLRGLSSKEKKNLGLSKYMKKKFLNRFFKVDNEKELVKKNKYVKMRVREMRSEIMDETGLDIKEFPKWQEEEIENFIKLIRGERKNV